MADNPSFTVLNQQAAPRGAAKCDRALTDDSDERAVYGLQTGKVTAPPSVLGQPALPDDNALLEQPDRGAVLVNVNIHGGRAGGQSGHSAHLSAQRIEEASPYRWADIPNRYSKPGWSALQ